MDQLNQELQNAQKLLKEAKTPTEKELANKAVSDALQAIIDFKEEGEIPVVMLTKNEKSGLIEPIPDSGIFTFEGSKTIAIDDKKPFVVMTFSDPTDNLFNMLTNLARMKQSELIPGNACKVQYFKNYGGKTQYLEDGNPEPKTHKEDGFSFDRCEVLSDSYMSRQRAAAAVTLDEKILASDTSPGLALVESWKAQRNG